MDSQLRNLGLEIWKKVIGEKLSSSHDKWHIDQVMKFAFQLQSIYSCDKEILEAAVLMHDLGRGEPNLHGEDSIQSSLDQAQEILSEIGFPQEKAKSVLLAISEHDKPDVVPSTIEGRILKDADFLAGFGAWGILRIALWAGETGGRVEQIMDRLNRRLPKRVESLEFPESQRWARKELLFSNLFLAKLEEPPTLSQVHYDGKYIILEGVSGTGKDTQVRFLEKRLREEGYRALVVSEPAEIYKEFRDLWEDKHKETLEDPDIRSLLLIIDRYKQIIEKVKPALERGEIVLSGRSYISFLVYQCANENGQLFKLNSMAYLHQFVPIPDLIILYDIDPSDAYRRIIERKRERSRYEKIELLELHRNRFLEVVNSGVFGRKVEVINADRTIEEIATDTWDAVESVLGVNEQIVPRKKTR